jgi:hypothetical protein
VWALEGSIEALRGFGAVYMVGSILDERGEKQEIKLWMRANRSGTASKDVLARLGNGVVQWVQDGGTFTYIPQNNTVYHEDAMTAGTTPWLGPALLEQFRGAAGSRTVYGTDPASGRSQVTLLCSMFGALGPQSFSISFDVETKLPVAMTVWSNMDRSGTPGFRVSEIEFHEDLPAGMFTFAYPRDARRVEKEMTVADPALGLLVNPAAGIPVGGMSVEAASRKILSQLYEAIRDEDIATIRRLCPTLSSWDDGLIRALLLRPGQRPAEVVEIRSICKHGNSGIGPIVALPVVVRTGSGILREDKIIVQFRDVSGTASCVVYGPYGQSRDLE